MHYLPVCHRVIGSAVAESQSLSSTNLYFTQWPQGLRVMLVIQIYSKEITGSSSFKGKGESIIKH
jgi:hypothetical protein